MNKYYHRGNRECVVPDRHIEEPHTWTDNTQWNKVRSYFDEHISSLPVAATLDFDAPIGWIDNVREEYQIDMHGQGIWGSVQQFVYEKNTGLPRRILLVKGEEAPNKLFIENSYRSVEPPVHNLIVKPVTCAICGEEIKETGTAYNGEPVHIGCYHKAGDAADNGEKEEVLNEIGNEVKRAKRLYPNNFVNQHEGYGVILEELDELWGEIKKNQQDYDLSKQRKEAIQCAAMLVRFITELTPNQSK